MQVVLVLCLICAFLYIHPHFCLHPSVIKSVLLKTKVSFSAVGAVKTQELVTDAHGSDSGDPLTLPDICGLE